ncbi:unnamed protein product, partial [Owenia fusiformis]
MSSNRGGNSYEVPSTPNYSEESAYGSPTGPRGEHFYTYLTGGKEPVYPGLNGNEPRQDLPPTIRYDSSTSTSIYAEIKDPSNFAKLAMIIAFVAVCVVIAVGGAIIGMHFAGSFTDTPATTKDPRPTTTTATTAAIHMTTKANPVTSSTTPTTAVEAPVTATRTHATTTTTPATTHMTAKITHTTTTATHVTTSTTPVFTTKTPVTTTTTTTPSTTSTTTTT